MKRKTDTKKWFSLDLSATVYPALESKRFSNMYRLSAVLKEDVDVPVMQEALTKALNRFPTFKVSIHNGFFWRYFEPNESDGPFLKEDIQNFCMPMNIRKKNSYLIRYYYYRNRISVEMHHCLADGMGGMSFFMTALGIYYRMKGYDIPYSGMVFNENEDPDPGELEDSYVKYSTSDVHPKREHDKCYRLQGTPAPFYTFNIIEGLVSGSEVKAVAKKYGVTITEYLCAVLLYSLSQCQKNNIFKSKKPIRIALPVNLRGLFPSKTVRNFITMIYPYIDPRLGEYSFEEIVTFVRDYMRFRLNKKLLSADISTNLAARTNPFSRLVPLFFKDKTIKAFYSLVQDRNSSAGLTNMGVLDLPKELKEHIEKVDICLGPPFSARTNCAIISMDDVMTINFSNNILETEVEKYFFRKLVKDGIHVKIQCNHNNIF